MAALRSGSNGKRQSARGVVILLVFLIHFASTAFFASASSVKALQELRDNEEESDLTLERAERHHRHSVRRRDTAARQTTETVHSTSLSPPPPPPPPAPCHISCQGVKQRPVCASDGVTYSSKCELRRYRDCAKKELRVVSKGRCPDETRCQEERRMARYELLQRPAQDVYIPECKADGNFMGTQCHDGTGYCWCVRSDGKPIPGSSVEGHNTSCQKTGKKSQNAIASKHRRGVGVCSPYGRSIFNQNLIRRFNEEYARAPKPAQQTTAALSKAATGGMIAGQCQGEAESCAQRRVIEWKFSELDLDKDNELKRKELKTLRYLVNKIVEPHACALSFLENCDWDNNKKIALNEWSKCLRVVHHSTANLTSHAQQSTNSKKKGAPTTQKLIGDRKLLTRLKPGPSRSVSLSDNRPNSLSQKRTQARIPLKPLKATFYDLKSRSKAKETLITTIPRNKAQESGPRDIQQGQGQGPSEAFKSRLCDDARQKAKDNDRADPDGHIFIPECDSNGLFKKAQCHNSTGYCWCVDEKTGVPIPGISTHNVTPDCSDVKTNNLKGCPFPTKKRFLEELLDHITQEMVERANNGTSASQLNEPDPEQSIEERAVRWKMATMDSNHNSVLEKGEVKDFREAIKRLKKKKVPTATLR